MERKGKVLSRAQFLQKFQNPPSVMQKARDILTRLESKVIVTYCERGGGQYVECVYDDDDRLFINSGGRWRAWCYNDEYFLEALKFLERMVERYEDDNEELPF